MNIVLQEPTKPGAYVSELIDGRYQVLESSFYEGQYFIFDHQTDQIIRDKKGDNFELFSDLNAARHFIGAGAVVVKKKGQRIKGEKKATGYVKKGRKESALSYMKELLTKQSQLTDEKIVHMVKDKFPDSNYNASMVKFNRKKLAKG